MAASCALLIAATTGQLPAEDEPAGKTNVTAEPSYDSPLDRLKARSPEDRWQQLNSFDRKSRLLPPTSDGQPRSGGLQPPSGRFEFNGGDAATAPAPEQPNNGLLPPKPGRLKDVPAEDELLELPLEFPSQETDDGYRNRTPAAKPTGDLIYQEIEDEFPRIRMDALSRPELDEPLPPATEYDIPADLPGEPLESEYTPQRTEITAQLPDFEDDWDRDSMGDLVTSPSQLKPLSDIQPYFDYEPSAELRKTDPYRNVYPRPDGVMETEQGKQFPEVIDLGNELYQHRSLAHVDYYWAASDFWHYPLYFEDADFERYGHTHAWWLQPFVSFGVFGVQFFGLPYQMSLHPMWQKQYALGWYRPGECAPYRYYQIPWNTDAAVRTGAFYTGMIFAFP